MVFNIILFCLIAWRIYSILPSKKFEKRAKRNPTSACSLAVFLGSGGHTSEALALLSGLDFQRYRPRQYFVSEGDSLSVKKVLDLERSRGTSTDPSHYKPYQILTIPRARRVHQSLLTTPITAVVSLFSCVYYMTFDPLITSISGNGKFADVLILNGPGTCLMLCLSAYANKFLGLPAPTIVYIESFARVKGLSLSGKLIQPLADRFIVQWPQLRHRHSKAECHGVLV